MYKFKDYYHNTVQLSFERYPFSPEPKHVWVVCRYGDQWLLTHHLRRGLEFPGGKVELGKHRKKRQFERFMKKPAIVSDLTYLGQYKVSGKDKIIIKNIYFATISAVEEHTHYEETKGSVLLKDIPDNIKTNRKFSFIMRDDVLARTMKHIEEIGCFTK